MLASADAHVTNARFRVTQLALTLSPASIACRLDGPEKRAAFSAPEGPLLSFFAAETAVADFYALARDG